MGRGNSPEPLRGRRWLSGYDASQAWVFWFESLLEPKASWPGCFLNMQCCGGLSTEKKLGIIPAGKGILSRYGLSCWKSRKTSFLPSFMNLCCNHLVQSSLLHPLYVIYSLQTLLSVIISLDCKYKIMIAYSDFGISSFENVCAPSPCAPSLCAHIRNLMNLFFIPFQSTNASLDTCVWRAGRGNSWIVGPDPSQNFGGIAFLFPDANYVPFDSLSVTPYYWNISQWYNVTRNVINITCIEDNNYWK